MTKKDVQPVDTKELSTLLADINYQDALRSEDVAIPIIKIVQKGSESIMETHPEAKHGMLYNSATEELLGNALEFIPCAFEGKYLMRTPLDKGGGFGGTFNEKPEGFDISIEGRWHSKEQPDMEVVYTHYHAVLLIGTMDRVIVPVNSSLLDKAIIEMNSPRSNVLKQLNMDRAIIAMNSTQLKISKKWNASFRNRVNGPIFLHTYSAMTQEQRSNNFAFRGWSNVVRVRESTMEEIREAADFYKYIKSLSLRSIVSYSENSVKDDIPV